ncbi:hypothetical protein OIU78_022948 [Salix suchowensis]|nr:hypothetical protein OIU78_022948 [Salix suchowensis]
MQMEKQSPSTSPSPPSVQSESSSLRELQCVGTLEIARPKPPVGFLCGSIPVLTDKSFHGFNSALVPSSRQTVSAPRYRMLPMETDLNTLPVVSNLPEKALPISAAVQSKFKGEFPWDADAISSNHTRKCEALAVSGLVEYGDEIDVIASADILKQIFKIPYSKARLSIAVRRIGQTLVLNKGPDAEEGERLVRRHKNQSKKCTDQSLFLNFAMHSVRMEACDCPPTHPPSSKGHSNSSVLPGRDAPQFVGQSDDVTRNEETNHCAEYPHVKQDNFFWESKKNKRNKDHHPVKKSSHLGEKPRSSMQESEKHKRVSNDGFLRVLFWQFHNFRMLLGSDLLLFSNEKYVAVSLHLWDVTRQVTPLTWLEAWLDNVMASVPELAICYHQDGVVQGYELLKTDDIFLLKGISEDGTPAFQPHVVQQNGLSVLRFLEENCKQDPGAYWLYKSAGEDMIQLFDLCVIPKTRSSSDCDDGTSSLPSLMHRGRSDSLFSLGTLLYRIAHRLSLSMAPNNKAKCARFFQQCLEFLDDPDHLVVRASAHEQFARLLLNHDKELDLTFESLPGECEVPVPVDSSDPLSRFSESVAYENVSSVAEDRWSEEGKAFQEVISEASVRMTLESNISTRGNFIELDDTESKDSGVLPSSSSDEMVSVCKVSPTPPHAVQAVADPVSSKLAAVHHVSQAIKSLRWMHQLQSSDSELLGEGGYYDGPPSSMNFSVCACGDADCIEVCDIRQWLPTSKVDEKLWKLVLLLGESYLALGQAYKEDKQLHQALKVVELACAVYGSMPQFLEDSRFISSMVTYSSSIKCNDVDEKMIACISNRKEVKSSSNDSFFAYEQFSSTYLFWAKAWTLVGDVYVEFHFMKGKVLSNQSETKSSARELRISTEVVKEVQRLKKKLGQHNQNCSSCSLLMVEGTVKDPMLGVPPTHSWEILMMAGHITKEESSKYSGEYLQLDRGDNDTAIDASGIAVDKHEINSLANTNSDVLDGGLETHDAGSSFPSQSETNSKEKPKPNEGGIFKYTSNPAVGDAEYNLSAALSCYQEARKALSGLPTGSAELQSVVKKIGWVCNEMGRNRLEGKELNKAEHAFADAIVAFREVSDHANIILINCNLGHALQTAKLEYSESLGYYGAARAELNAIAEGDDSVPTVLRNEVQTQFAHTYLRLGMLLAKEDVTTRVYENGAFEDMPVVTISPDEKRDRKELRKHEISANDAIREALTVYESLGELRKQEAAYAYCQLASYQRDCCLKFLNLDLKKTNLNKNENNNLQRVKQYACLAERNWQKAMDFYSPKTHPAMHLTILIERSALSLSLSSTLHSNLVLESALARMLEGRHISDAVSDCFGTDYPEIHAKFWGQLQMLLKKMLSLALSANANKPAAFAQPTPTPSKFGDAGKLRELYKISLKSSNLSQLHAMHTLWTS